VCKHSQASEHRSFYLPHFTICIPHASSSIAVPTPVTLQMSAVTETIARRVCPGLVLYAVAAVAIPAVLPMASMYVRREIRSLR
jgi:hypothetical protein